MHYAAAHPTLHKIILQESSHPNERLDWVIENFLQPLSEVAVGYVAELQEKGVVPAGNPALIYNMIRVSSGGLIALALELKGTADIDLTSEESLDNLTDTIVRIFLPGEVAAN